MHLVIFLADGCRLGIGGLKAFGTIRGIAHHVGELNQCRRPELLGCIPLQTEGNIGNAVNGTFELLCRALAQLAGNVKLCSQALVHPIDGGDPRVKQPCVDRMLWSWKGCNFQVCGRSGKRCNDRDRRGDCDG